MEPKMEPNMELETYKDPNLVPSRLDEEPGREFSIVTLTGGWPEDLERFYASLQAFCGELDWELIAVSNNSPEIDQSVERAGKDDTRVRGISFSQRVGFGGGINSAIERSLGRIVVVVDTSIEPTGDFLSPIAASLADPSTGLVGKWGLISADLHHFDEETSGEVDAMQAYLMAFRRSDVKAVGLFDPKFKFYRHADIDYSLRWRDKDFEILAVGLPLLRHAHREWESMSDDQREVKSRDNFARLLRSWRDRNDLLTGRGEPHHNDH